MILVSNLHSIPEVFRGRALYEFIDETSLASVVGSIFIRRQ